MAGEPSFYESIRAVADGEDVSAAVTNRAITQLDSNIRYLRSLLSQVESGTAVLARDQLVAEDALVGMPVYYHAAHGRFERALGAADVDAATGAFLMSATAQALGIVFARKNTTTGTVLLAGMADLDLSAAISGDVAVGRYYLSNQTAGQLEQQRPPVGVSILQVAQLNPDGTQRVFVNVSFHDLLEAHRHYEFALVARPAGTVTPPDPGDRHVITDPDAALEGWLPADHASFAGRAPLGAAFGYNLAASSLRYLWPPVPARAYLELSREGDGSSLGQGVDSQLCIIDRHGLWWLSDCYDRVPWPTLLDTTSSLSESLTDCPLDLDMRLRLWFTKPVFANTGSWVASLTTAAHSGLAVRCVDTGEAASTGHLEIDLDLGLAIEATDQPGHIVLKTLADNRVQAGPVVESLTPVGNNVTITSDVAAGADGQRYGRLAIAVDQDLEAGELGVDVVRLSGVQEEFYQEVLGLGFRAGQLSSFRGRITIPAGLALPVGTRLKLVFWILNRASTAIPAGIFTLSYRRIPAPTTTPLALPLESAEVALSDLPAANVAVTAANQYVLLESDTFPVAAGEQVLFSLTRAGQTDGLNGDLYVLRQFAKYVKP